MKNKYGFVSNSSSCSFVISKEYLTDNQVGKIIRWYDEASEHCKYGMGDSGTDLKNETNYISGEVRNVMGDWLSFCEDNGIEEDKIYYKES